MKNIFFIVFIACYLPTICFAQSDDDFFDRPTISSKGTTSAGFGIGLPYGGLLGMNLSYNIIDRLNTFAGLGFNLVGLGVNAGLSYDLIAFDRFAFYASGMGGYNAVTKVFGLEEYDKAYYGFSTGTGIKIGLKDKGYFRLGVILPFRKDAYYKAVETISNDSRVELYSKPSSLLFSLGFNFIY